MEKFAGLTTKYEPARFVELVHVLKTEQAWQKFLALPFHPPSSLRQLPANSAQSYFYSNLGAVVDQEALVIALRSGVIRAAALDVTYPEPLPRSPSHLFLFLRNTV